jgi:hypothetical protein
MGGFRLWLVPLALVLLVDAQLSSVLKPEEHRLKTINSLLNKAISISNSHR